MHSRRIETIEDDFAALDGEKANLEERAEARREERRRHEKAVDDLRAEESAERHFNRFNHGGPVRPPNLVTFQDSLWGSPRACAKILKISVSPTVGDTEIAEGGTPRFSGKPIKCHIFSPCGPNFPKIFAHAMGDPQKLP